MQGVPCIVVPSMRDLMRPKGGEEMTRQSKDRLLERVRKALALTTSSNEGEMAAAWSRVHAMLAEHNLTMEEVENMTSDMLMSGFCATKVEPWRRSIGTMIGQLYFCIYFYHDRVEVKPVKHSDVHYMAGEKHNVAVARLMFFYVCETIERLANEATKAIPHGKKKYRESFIDACTMRVCARIKERIDKARCGTADDWSGNTLPVLASEYDRKLLEAKAFMDQQYGMSEDAVTERNLPTITNAHGLQAGLLAGDKIGLEPQVGNNVPKRLS